MTLKNQFLLLCIVLVSSVLALGGFSVTSLRGLSDSSKAMLAEIEAADRAEVTAVKVGWLRDSFRGIEPRTTDDVSYFAALDIEINAILERMQQAQMLDEGDASVEAQLEQSIRTHYDSAKRLAGVSDSSAAGENNSSDNAPKPTPAELKKSAEELEQVRLALASTSRTGGVAAQHRVVRSIATLSHRLNWTYLLLIVVAGIAVFVCVRQYMTLVRPLLWLREEMRRSAARQFQEEIRPRGQREFKDLADYFNGLARDLADIYRDLENKVIARSRELVRSERLASVGFLAAGVAHEINNPLSIISGYAELAGKGLRRVMLGEVDPDQEGPEAEAEAEALSSALDAQTIIRDEAFRCKEITSRLLSLARGGADERKPLCLDDVARQVAILTKGLKNYRDREVVIELNEHEHLEVFANATEMKQVFLNLTINALEATPPGRGTVTIGGRHNGEWVELSVQDNGKGMSTETIEQVFEPFFTAKRGAGEPGTGLGLSITHAIIENHGGRIRAESAGPGRGSRFTVRLPAITRGAMLATAN